MTETQIIKSNLNLLLKFTRKTCIRILLIVCLFLLLGKTVKAPENGISKEYYWECYKATKFESATQQLVLQVDSFIRTYAEDSKLSAERLVELCDLYHIDIKLAMAQGLLESHFGTKGRAVETNSVFNVGTYDDGRILYKYKNPNESIEPYVQLLKTRYLTIEKNEVDLLKKHQFIDIQGKRYASSRLYEQKLAEIIEFISIKTSLDSLITVREETGLIKRIDDISDLTKLLAFK